MMPLNDDRNGSFDVFISYKSQDADLVRTFAEWLQACGLRVWFAEYQILLRDRKDFLRAIDQGIAGSSVALLFTSDEYFASEHCIYELKKLASRITPESNGLFEISLAQEPRSASYYSQNMLQHTPAALSHQSIQNTMKWLVKQLPFGQLRLPSATPEQPENQITGLQKAFRLDLTGCEISESGAGWTAASIFEGPKFSFEHEEKRVEGELSIASVRGMDRRSNNYDTGEAEERAYYDMLIAFSDGHSRDTKMRPIGVHLVNHENQKHFALSLQKKQTWQRQYFIELPDAYGNGLEFELKFQTSGSREHFFGAIPFMDRIAKSLWLDSRLRFVTLMDLDKRHEIKTPRFELSYGQPIGWKAPDTQCTHPYCDIDFRRSRATGFWSNLRGLNHSPRPRLRMFRAKGKDMLNLQVQKPDRDPRSLLTENTVVRGIQRNRGKVERIIIGSRHGCRTIEVQYSWKRGWHNEYGFQIHFALGPYIFSVQLNSLLPFRGKDERLLEASAFADSIRVPGAPHEPERI